MNPSKLSDYFKKDHLSQTRLELAFKEIYVLDPLGFKPSSIIHLDLSFNLLQSLDGIDQFPSLTYLNISNNLIKNLICLSSIKRKELLCHLQIKGNPAARHPNLFPIIFNYFPNIREIDTEPVNFSIQKDIMQAMELSSSLIPYLYINEQLILKIHKDIQYLQLKFELFDATWNKLPNYVLPNVNEVKKIHARFLNKYPEIVGKTMEGKVRPTHVLEFIQEMKDQININSAHLEEEIVCKIYKWLYCEIVLQLHSHGNVDLQCFLQTYDEPSMTSSVSIDRKVDGITSDLMKFSQLSHYPQSLLHFPVFGCNAEYMKALYLVLNKQISVIQSLIKERKNILLKDLKEVCDEVQSPPSKMSYPSLHSYEYCSPSVLRDFVSPSSKSPNFEAFFSPKFRQESAQGTRKVNLDFIKDELISKLDFEDESDMDITNSYDELSQTIEELLRDDDKEDEKHRIIYLNKIKRKYFLALRYRACIKKVLGMKKKKTTKKILRAWKSLSSKGKSHTKILKKLKEKKQRYLKKLCFQKLKKQLPTSQDHKISEYFYLKQLKIKALRGFYFTLCQKDRLRKASVDHFKKMLMFKTFRSFEYFLKVLVAKKNKIRQYKIKSLKIVLKKILKAWLYLVRPSAKFIKKQRPESNSQLDKLLDRLKKKDKEVVKTFKRLKRPQKTGKIY